MSGINGGAGIWNVGGSPTLINCTLVGNTTVGAGIVGGAMYTTQAGVPVLANCAVYGNSAYEGSGLYCSFSSNPDIVNSIVWGNAPGLSGLEIVVALGAVASATYSDIEGGFPGVGNLDTNPIFADADGEILSGHQRHVITEGESAEGSVEIGFVQTRLCQIDHGGQDQDHQDSRQRQNKGRIAEGMPPAYRRG